MKSKIRWKPNARENKAMMAEINRQIIEADARYKRDLVALVLYALHIHPDTKYGKKRLKHFYMTFDKIHQEMLDHYEMCDNDAAWLANQKLKDIGVDIDAWEKELNATSK